MNKEELESKIIEANKAYRSGDAIMDDATFDSLVEDYRKLVDESTYNSFRNSLNEGQVEYGTKVSHKYIAGSLDKIKAEEPEEVNKFLTKHVKDKICISAKIDGLSGIAKYNGGLLIGFATRGDGTVGIDIFNKAQFIKFLPKSINVKSEIYVRGELVILNSDYNKIEGSSARNIVAGLINRKEFNENDIMNVSFIAYTIMGPEYTKSEQFDILEHNGFKTAWHETIGKNDIQNINEYLFNLASNDYGMKTDGLVICDPEYRNEEKYRPDACCAYKINQQSFETRLIDIEWQGPSKDGKMVPVGIVEPTEVGGVVVSKVTLNNLDFIKDLNLKIGDRVSILRSGDVIPKLISVVSTDENSVDINPPSECPCCGSELVREGPFVYCKNENCTDKTISQVETFIENLGIENASFKTLKKFGITNIEKLLQFKANQKYKSETKFENELKNKMFNRSKRELFCSLNMKDLASKTLNVIVEHYGWDSIESNSVDSDPFVNLPSGIGDITMNKFLDNYKKNLGYVKMITEDTRYDHNENETVVQKATKNGMSVCFTGKLYTMGRAEASRLAEEHGYEVKGSVTKGLTYLVTNDKNSGSSKNEKAKKLGTKVIDEKEFLELVKDNAMNVDDL